MLGNYVVHYQQIHNIALDHSGPLYERDVIKYDKQDDNAASRLFSAELLRYASQNPREHLGIVVYIFVFSDFIDAYQSRTMPHQQCIQIAIRTLLFLETWRLFLKKQGYIEDKHFISRAAYDIAKTLAKGLLGLVIIHRDHLPSPTPLLTWKHVSEGNERHYANMRVMIPDFTVLQSILMAPKLHTLASASSQHRFSKAGYKKTVNGYQHTNLLEEGIDYELLKAFSSDAEFTEAYRAAVEENDTLWTLVGLHPAMILSAPMPSIQSMPVDNSPESLPDIPHIDSLASDQSILDGLQTAIDSINTATNLTRTEDEELDACTFAAVALALEKLAKM